MEEKKHPLVSVITIFFNAEKFIKESIESVLNQSYVNWELLLVDDGSSDQSAGMAIEYSKKYPDKIKYLHHMNHQNKGMSTSRNLGISMSGGSLISFLDADDIWLSDKLKDQVNIMSANPEVSMLYGNTIFWRSWQHGIKKKDYIRRLGVKPDTIFNPPDLIPLFLVVAAAVPATCSIMCRRSLFLKVLFEESFTGLYEDQAFYYKVCLSENVYVTDKIWDKYRQHENSACYLAEKNGEMYSSRINFLLWFWAYINKNNFRNNSINLAIYQEFWKNRFLKDKSNRITNMLRWVIKWSFIFEMNFPKQLRLFFWHRTKTYKFLSRINSQASDINDTSSIIWNNR